MAPPIDTSLPVKELTRLRRRNHLDYLALFGSAGGTSGAQAAMSTCWWSLHPRYELFHQIYRRYHESGNRNDPEPVRTYHPLWLLCRRNA